MLAQTIDICDVKSNFGWISVSLDPILTKQFLNYYLWLVLIRTHCIINKYGKLTWYFSKNVQNSLGEKSSFNSLQPPARVKFTSSIEADTQYHLEYLKDTGPKVPPWKE